MDELPLFQSETKELERLNELEKKSNLIIEKSKIEQWPINASIHYNRWANFTKNDFEPVVKAFKDLFQLFTCSKCGATISISLSKGKNPKSIVSCDCGKIFWNIQ